MLYGLLCISVKNRFIKHIWMIKKIQNTLLLNFLASRYFHFILRFPNTSSIRSKLTSTHAGSLHRLHVSRSECLNARYLLCKLHFKQRLGSLFFHLFFKGEFLWDKINAFANKVAPVMFVFDSF